MSFVKALSMSLQSTVVESSIQKQKISGSLFQGYGYLREVNLESKSVPDMSAQNYPPSLLKKQRYSSCIYATHKCVCFMGSKYYSFICLNVEYI